MEIKIYSQNGTLRASVPPADSSTVNEELMSDHVLTLSFTHFEYINLEVNDYVDFLGKRYWLLKNYRPQKKSSVEYQYDVKFYGIESKLKKGLVLKMVDGDNSTSFSLNDSPAQHLQLFVDNMNRITGSDVWAIGQVIDAPNLNIEYDCVSVFDGLGKLAEGTGTEWWVEGYTMNLCRCEHGDLLELGYGKGLLSVSKDSNDNAPFFTRLYPIGSTRNIDRTKYGSSRLHLPGGAQYVEQNTDLGIVEYSEESAFKDIYPRRVGQVGVVRSEKKMIEDVERDIYYFTDPGLTFNPDDYEIAGLVKMVKFQSGELNGQDFEVNWHNDTKEFEVINQYPYENQQLPGGQLIPKTGNDYVLYNLRMPDEYYKLAEEELAAAVADFLKKYSIDTAVYKAPTDYVDFEKREINLKIGRRVRLYSEYFDAGYQDSRVVSISRKLNNPFSMDIGCSMAVSSTKLSKMENNITEIQAAFKEQLNKDVLQVLKSWDSADPSEYNVFSARRSLGEFILKKKDDIVQGIITFLNGIRIGKFVTGMIGGKGAAITVDKYGKTTYEGDRAIFREELIVPKITFNCIDIISGDKANTFSFGTIKSIDKIRKIATLDLLDDQMGTPKVNDICRGIFHNIEGNNIMEDAYDENGFLGYAGFSTSYFTPVEILENKPGTFSFRYEIKNGTLVHPMPGMNFFAYGNFTDKQRQAVTYENRYYTRRLIDVNTWVIDPDKNIAMQDGLLEGLTIGGQEMHGYGTYQTNCYFTGVQIKFTPEQTAELQGESAYSVNLSDDEGVIVVDDDGNISGGISELMNVIVDGKNVTADSKNVILRDYKLKTRIQVFKGSQELFHSPVYKEGAYTIGLTAVGCTAFVVNGVVVVSSVTDYKECYVDIAVNCEGNAVFQKTYRLTAVRNGNDGNDATSYWLDSPVTQLGVNSIGSVEPSSFLVYSRAQDGEGTPYLKNWYLQIWVSNDNATWVKYGGNVYANSITVRPVSTYKYYSIRAYSSSSLSDDYRINAVSVVLVKDGNNIASSSSPRNRQEFNTGERYYWNSKFRDIVYDTSGAVWMVNVFNETGYVTSVPSINNGEWTQGSRDTFRALDTALIDGANIAGFMYKNQVMRSQEESSTGVPNTILNGKDGSIRVGELSLYGKNNSNQGIYYAPNKYNAFRMQPGFPMTVDSNGLEPDERTLNVLLYLLRKRNNKFDRVLYAAGISEFSGKLVVACSGNGTGSDDGTVLHVKGGTVMNGNVSSTPLVVSRSCILATGYTIYRITGNGITVNLQDVGANAADGTVLVFITSGTNNWTLRYDKGIYTRGQTLRTSISITTHYEIWRVWFPEKGGPAYAGYLN